MKVKYIIPLLIIGSGAFLTGILLSGFSDTVSETLAEEVKKTEEPGKDKDNQKEKEITQGESTHKDEDVEDDGEELNKSTCLLDENSIRDFMKKKKELAIQTQELKKKESDLIAKDKALKEELARIEAVRDEIKQLNQLASAQNEERLSKLVETFESMSPKSAAQVISNIDEFLAVEALRRTSSAKLGKILSALDTKKSAVLTERLAGVVRAPKHESTSNDVAETTIRVKGGDENGNRKQLDNADPVRKQPEPAIGK